jgi:hypothetical protein
VNEQGSPRPTGAIPGNATEQAEVSPCARFWPTDLSALTIPGGSAAQLPRSVTEPLIGCGGFQA